MDGARHCVTSLGPVIKCRTWQWINPNLRLRTPVSIWLSNSVARMLDAVIMDAAHCLPPSTVATIPARTLSVNLGLTATTMANNRI